MSKLLILGGTSEAVQLADRLAGERRLEVTTSLAGRTSSPRRVAGRVRTGGFGGADGLRAYIERARIEMLVDATHPFSSRISAHAAQACGQSGVPRLQIRRPPWTSRPGDCWIHVRSMEEAADRIEASHRTVFLSTGQKGLELFAAHKDVRFVVRLVEAPKSPLPLDNHTLILARGPFSDDDEKRLLTEHEIDLVVSKNSGGAGTFAKIGASRELGLPVMMIEQPPPEEGPHVESVDSAHDWVVGHLQG